MSARTTRHTATCASPRCRARGRHTDQCDDTECTGCQPRQAAPGSNLCHVCTRRLAEDITETARLWSELGLALTKSDRPGERVSGASIDKSTNLNERAMKARTRIWATLADWARFVATERGLTRPPDQPAALASMLHRHVDWLAAHRHAALVADQMAELAHGRARSIAYPTGARLYDIAPCPVTDDDQVQCPGTIRAVVRPVDSLLPSELICDVDDAHRWNPSAWLHLGRILEAKRGPNGPTG